MARNPGDKNYIFTREEIAEFIIELLKKEKTHITIPDITEDILKKVLLPNTPKNRKFIESKIRYAFALLIDTNKVVESYARISPRANFNINSSFKGYKIKC